MPYRERIEQARRDPGALEALYRQAAEAGEAPDFASSIEQVFASDPGDLLLGAWHHRLAAEPTRPMRRAVAWVPAILLAVANGLSFWLLSADQLVVDVGALGSLPVLALIWAPISAVFVTGFLVVGGLRQPRLAIPLVLGVLALGVYPLWARTLIGDPALEEQYVLVAVPHLALLAWAGTGLLLLWSRATSANRFGFLVDSLNVFVMAGLLAIAGAIFTAVTIGLFAALSVNLADEAVRLIVAGGAGLIPVLAVAIVYDPAGAPADQPLEEGLGRVVAMLMRLLLPLTLIVLTIYVVLIPFRLMEPFENRDVLFIYNVTVFAVIALLVGATPASPDAIGSTLRRWLRWLLVAIAVLTLAISLYELAAIAYRTWDGGLTINRLTILGWNLVNTAILAALLIGQWRADATTWIAALQRAFGMGMPLYAGWGLLVILVMPWLFR